MPVNRYHSGRILEEFGRQALHFSEKLPHLTMDQDDRSNIAFFLVQTISGLTKAIAKFDALEPEPMAEWKILVAIKRDGSRYVIAAHEANVEGICLSFDSDVVIETYPMSQPYIQQYTPDEIVCKDWTVYRPERAKKTNYE